MASKSSPRSRLTAFLMSCLAVLGAVILLGTCGESPKPTASQAQPLSAEDVVADELVVDFRDGTTKARYDELEKGWGLDLEFNSVEGAESGVTLGRIDPARRDELLARIRQDPNVEAAEPLLRYRATMVPNDPQFKAQWNFELIAMRDAWDTTRGAGVTVAVIDTGIAYEDNGEFKTVPDLKGAKFAKGYDFVNDDDHANDDHGHGTHVAGTIAQRTNNREGVAGIAFEATLMPVKVLDANGTGTSADIADAIRWAADHGAKVLNLSLGGGGRSQVMESAVAYARKKGAVVVCAAGNAGRGTVEYPAAYPGAVAVSAIGPSGELAFYSSWGKELDISAPGGDKRRRDEDGVLQNTIDRSNPGASVYAFYQGTSMATPHVAGVAALLFAAGASGPDEVEKALFEGADHRHGAAWNEKYGHGILNAKGALGALGATGGQPFWKKVLMLAWAFVLWLITRGSVPLASRKFFKPGLAFVVGLVVSVMGLFFLPWIGLGSVQGFATLARPIPEWGASIFESAGANPLFYSAIIPILLAMFGWRRGKLRGALVGIAVGFAAMMLARLFSGDATVAWMPLSFLSIPWLLLNAVLALLLARAAMMGESSAGGAR